MLREFDIKLRTSDPEVTAEQIEWQIELYCTTDIKVIEIQEKEM